MPEIPILPKAKFAKNGEYESAYFTLGEKGAEPILFCHGLAANGLQFVEDAQFFADKGYFVIVPDLRGLGRSKMPKNRKESDFSIPHLVKDLLNILDKEKIEKINWVGNSLGGILALYIMGLDKKRLKTFTSFGTAYKLNVPQAFIPILKFGSESLGKEVSAQIGARATSSNPKAQAIIYEMLKNVDMWVVINMAKYVRHYDFIPNALQYENPILMIRGLSDFAVNAALKPTLKAMEGRDNFTLIDVKNAGHVANLDQPEKLREIILQFLSDNL